MLPFVVVFLKYAQTVLVETAQGYLKPTPLTSDKLFGNGLVVFKLLSILFAFKLLSWAGMDLFGQSGYYLATALTAIATPAVIMVLAMEDKFFSAINPHTLYFVIARIGMPYFIMFVLFYLLEIAQSYLLAILMHFIDPSWSFAVYAFVTMYFYIIMFNMMGYTIYQHHEVLDYHIDIEAHDQEDASEFDTVTVSPEMRAVEILIQEGKAEQAVTELRDLITKNPSDFDARQRMLKLLRLLGKRELHAQQAQTFMSYLIDENRMGNAAQILTEANPFDKSVKPAKPGERYEMAKYFKRKSKYKMA
jgi:hypothetical protein